jgi:hypothetical protein
MEWKKIYRNMAADAWDEKTQWCKENLYHGGHYEPNWHTNYPFIEFTDEKEYHWFLLRWS